MTLTSKLFTEMQTRASDTTPDHERRFSGVVAIIVFGLLIGGVTGCGSAGGRVKTPQPAAVLPAAPAPKVESPKRPAPTPTPIPVVKTPLPPPTVVPQVEPEPVVPLGETSVLVESEPVGAMVVVNGVPVGRTPKRVHLPISVQGFSRDTVSIKVRFIAEGVGHQSQTVEEVLTPLDRMPASLVFTPVKVQRKR